MTSWYSNLLTKTTSQISNLQSRLLSSEADGDTEDDTHVCRVLRNHYTEKGRPFPPWLPPDPKAPAAQAPVQPLYAQSSGRLQAPQQGGPPGSSGGGGAGLSSLWDNNAGGGGAPPQHPQSLRVGRAPPRGGSNAGLEDVQARPLPSQRAGSYQSVNQPPAGGGSTAQDRLRQRLWGGGSRGASPNQGAPFQPPPQASPSGGGGNYEDRFAPGGSYDSGRGNDYGPPSGGGMQRRQGLPNGPRGYR